MSLRNLFSRQSPHKAMQDSPRLNGLVLAVAGYLDLVVAEDPGTEVRPAVVARVLHESELAVLAALYVLEKKGIIKPHYGLYCAANASPIEVYSSLSEVPTDAPCDVCDEEHSTDDRSMYTELFFTVDPKQLSTFRAVAA